MCINVVSVTVFLFEWLSPRGYDMQKLPPRGKVETGAHQKTIRGQSDVL